MQLTRKAIELAIKAHEGQTREVSGLPYIVHPIETYAIVKKFKESHNIDAICAAAVCHDTLEDTTVTYEYLKETIGDLAASLVVEVTTHKETCSLMGKTAYINEKIRTISSYALVIKLADMLANVTDNPKEKTIKRISNHMSFLQSGVRKLSNTHLELIHQISYSIETLY